MACSAGQEVKAGLGNPSGAGMAAETAAFEAPHRTGGKQALVDIAGLGDVLVGARHCQGRAGSSHCPSGPLVFRVQWPQVLRGCDGLLSVGQGMAEF